MRTCGPSTTNGIAAMMTLTNGNAAVIIDNWRRDHEFVIIASSLKQTLFTFLTIVVWYFTDNYQCDAVG